MSAAPSIPASGALERELVAALEEDAHRALVDDTKKKAIVSSSSYDDFRSRVACAGMKPIASRELEFKAPLAPNKAVGVVAAGAAIGFDRSGSDASAAAAAAARGAMAARAAGSPGGGGGGVALPRTAAEFERSWRRIRADPAAQRAMLTALALPPGTGGGGGGAAKACALVSLFRGGLDAGLVSEAVAAFTVSSVGGSVPSAAGAIDAGGHDLPRDIAGATVLARLSECAGFGLACDLLTGGERDAVVRMASAIVAPAATPVSDAMDSSPAAALTDGAVADAKVVLAAYARTG
jgi:hypothetical protein